MASLLWLQGGACSGNTMSFLNAEEPSACDLVTDFGIDVLWHPSLGMDMGENVQNMLREITSGEKELDIFVFEGTVIMGPNGSGRFNMFADRPMKDWVSELSAKANAVVALGDCACWGGIPANAPNPSDSVGLQFLKRNHGGFLGADFKSKWGLPVINDHKHFSRRLRRPVVLVYSFSNTNNQQWNLDRELAPDVCFMNLAAEVP